MYIIGLSYTDIVLRYGSEWPALKALYLDSRLRKLTSKPWTVVTQVPLFELAAKTNITLSAALQPSPLVEFVVGYISTCGLGERTFGIAPSTLRLIRYNHFVMIFASDHSDNFSPLLGKNLSQACGTLELGIIFAAFTIMTALQVQKKRVRDFLKNSINTLAPLLNQSPPDQIDRLKLFVDLWVVFSLFVSHMYVSFLQSEKITPSVHAGNNTLDNILDRNMTVYAGYTVAHRIKLSARNVEWLFCQSTGHVQETGIRCRRKTLL